MRFWGISKTMIKIIGNCLIALFTYLLCSLQFSAAGENSCDQRRKEIEERIQEAKNFGNYYQVLGLEKAMREVNTYCKKNISQKQKNKNNDKVIKKVDKKSKRR